MLWKLGQAIVVAVIVGLLCIFAGMILSTVGGKAPILVAVGDFLSAYAWLIGLLAGAYHFFFGTPFNWPRPAG